MLDKPKIKAALRPPEPVLPGEEGSASRPLEGLGKGVEVHQEGGLEDVARWMSLIQMATIHSRLIRYIPIFFHAHLLLRPLEL